MEIHQLGVTDWERCMELQHRIARETAARNDAKATVLLTEHPNAITVGQSGSRGDIRASQSSLDKQNVRVHWINRAGGTIYHSI